MDPEKLRAQLADAFANRALLYLSIFRELSGEVGAGRAEDILSRAIEKRGAAAGAGLFAGLAPATPKTAADAFLAVSPADGTLYPHDRIDNADGSVTIAVRSCPLQSAWRAAGLDGEDLARMCRIAGRFDNGCFGAAAGLEFEAKTWTQGAPGCCRLHLRAKTDGAK